MPCLNCGCSSVQSSQHHAVSGRNLIIYKLPSSHPVFKQDMNFDCLSCWIKHRRYSNTDENKSNYSQNPDQLESYSGVVKTGKTKSIVDVDQTESVVVKEELPAVCERLDDVIEIKKEYESEEDVKPINIYDNYLDIGIPSLHHFAPDSQDDVPLLGVKTEMEEEQISNMEEKRMKRYKRDSASDSAVSSIGSERVPSLSDGEWGDGSDSAQESHSSKFRPYDNSFGRECVASHQPQKKHRMFGKRCFQCQIPSRPTRFVCATLKRVRHDHTYSAPFAAGHQRPAAVRDKRVRRLTAGSISDGGSSVTSSGQRLSRDEKRAKVLGIPLGVQDIINLPKDDFYERLSEHLSEEQLSLARDIRRRGKNKVASQNCRQRKQDELTSLADEVRSVRERRIRSQREHRSLIAERQRLKERFAALYRHVFQNLRDPEGQLSSQLYSLQHPADGHAPNKMPHHQDRPMNSTNDDDLEEYCRDLELIHVLQIVEE